jgi:predicted TIM-barrel fold metal-dependent hydrolase
MIVDWEHHYLPEELWLKKGGKKGERAYFYVNGKVRATMHPELCDVEGKLKVMDAVGIDIAVLSMAGSDDNSPTFFDDCKVWNEQVSQLVKKHPKKFVGLTAIPPLGGQEAFDELKRAVESLGFKGIVIRSQVKGLSLDAKELYPFYEKVVSLNIPLFIHPSGVPSGFTILDAPYDLYRNLGRELDLIVATTRIILSGLLDHFPDLKLVISHKGGGISAIRERLLYKFDPPGKYGSLNRKPFDDYFNKMYFNLAGHYGGMDSVKCALTAIRPSQLLFGTDFPQDFMEDPMKIKTYIEDIRKLDLDKKSIDLMLGGNAQRLLGL